METFREKEVPRQLEDIEAIVSQLDELAASLELAVEEAMVSSLLEKNSQILYVMVITLCRS